MPAFPHIFRPLAIGPVTVPNRLFVSAHSTQLVEDDPTGFHRWSVLGERAAAYYEERARGGFGLQVIGQTQVHPQSGTDRASSFVVEARDAYRRIVERCHEHGGRVFVQLNQNGREKGSSGPDAWDPLWSASPEPAGHGEMTKAMDRADIAALIAGFVTSAQLCQEAGIDGVEVHAAHPHLLGTWLVTAANRRTDEYGGSLENRTRLVLEIVDAIRRACGSEMAVGVRINGAWTMPGGQTVEESIAIAHLLDATGQVDFLDVSGWPGIGTIGSPFAPLVGWAAEVKRAVPHLPVFGVGRIVRPEQAEEILARGDVDLVAMTRASIADPELPVKARDGRTDEVRVCIGAGQGCLMRNRDRRPLACQQNAAVGREAEWGAVTFRPARASRRVTIVGGGPAGLEAAVVAARLGHEVTLLEQADELGGQVRLITRNARRAEFEEIVRCRAVDLTRLGVDVRLGTTATRDSVLAASPDAVIVATGGRPRVDGWYPPTPHLPVLAGADQAHVVTTWDTLDGRLDGSSHVVVVDAHGYHHTVDAVERLAALGVRTTVVTTTPVFAAEVDDHDRPAIMAALRDSPVELMTSTVVESIGSDTLVVRGTFRGDARVIEQVEHVVLSIGQTPLDALYHELVGAVDALHRIGDCVAPRGVEHAIFEGHRAARAL